MNSLKKTSLLSLALMSTVGLSNIVKADNVCKTYDNYYFFSVLNSASDLQNAYSSMNDDDLLINRIDVTFFETLPANAEAPKGNSDVISKRVCLSKNGEVDGTANFCNNNTWDLNDFYQAQTNFANGEIKRITVNVNGEEKSSTLTKYSTSSKDTDGEEVITTYYKHGKWYSREDKSSTILEYGGPGTDVAVQYKDRIDELVNMSVLALKHREKTGTTDGTKIEFSPFNSPEAAITRYLYVSEYKDAVNYALADPSRTIMWSSGKTAPGVLTPTLYRVKYRACEDIETYKAEIEYFVKETDGTLTPAEKYYKDIVTYNNNSLEDGYTKEVPTPKLSGCTADKSSVTVKIDGKDFYDKVIYTCKANQEINDNSKTGDALIYVAWAIGLGAIGYSVYYFRKLKKEEI